MSRILRGGPRPSTEAPLFVAPRRIPAEIVAARAEAARILADAHAEAEAIRATAHGAAADEVATAREAGRAAGHAEAAAACIEARALRDGALAEAEQALARVALAAAERLFVERLTDEPARIAAIVAEGVSRARRAREVVVRVHPNDAPVVEALRAEVAARAGRPGAFAVRADPAIARGGCLVETELGTVDARLETRLDALARALGV